MSYFGRFFVKTAHIRKNPSFEAPNEVNPESFLSHFRGSLFLFVLLADMLFVFRQLALADVGQSVMLVVLRKVKAHFLAECRYTHGNQHVDEFIASPAHGKGVEEYDDDGQQMVEEDHEAVPRARNQPLLDEDTREHRTEDTARSVSGKHVEGIVDP